MKEEKVKQLNTFNIFLVSIISFFLILFYVSLLFLILNNMNLEIQIVVFFEDTHAYYS